MLWEIEGKSKLSIVVVHYTKGNPVKSNLRHIGT